MAARKKTATKKPPPKRAAQKKRTGPRVVRCSSLLHASRCLAAVAQEEEVRAEFAIPEQISNEGSRLGVAYHDLQAFSQKHGYEKAMDQMVPIARKHGADLRELGWLWSRLRVDSSVEFFDNIAVEEGLSAEMAPGLNLEGTPDLVRTYNKGKALDVIDWKSGRLAVSDDPDAYGHDQVISYAVLSVSACGEENITNARAIIYPVRLGDRPTIYTMDPKTYVTEADRIQQLVIDIDRQRGLLPEERTYGIGNHCKYCDGRRTCPAYRNEMEAAVAFVDHVKATGTGSREKNAERKDLILRKVGEVVADEPMKAFYYMRLAKELSDRLSEALKHDAEFWGNIDTKDGKYLGFKDYQTACTLNAAFARQVISKVLTERLAGKSEGAEIDSIVDAIDEELSNRPTVPRRRFAHHKHDEEE